MIKPLFISSKENAGILKKALSGLEHEKPRVQVGKAWSLKCFIDSDLKNYLLHTHIILDVSAFREQGEEFISQLERLKHEHEKAAIILYCGNLFAGDLLLNRFVEAGFTNIIADYEGATEKENLSLMREDLRECLSGGLSAEKYARFILPQEEEENFGERNSTPDVLGSENKEQELSNYPDDYRAITLFSSQGGIGATTFALSLCKYVAQRGGKAALVLFGEKAKMEQDLLREYYNGIQNENFVSVNGVDVFVYEELKLVEDYNLVVFDFGNVQDKADSTKDFSDVDGVYLFCGVGWNELRHTVSAHKYLTGLRYTAIVDADENVCAKYENELCRNLNEYLSIATQDAGAQNAGVQNAAGKILGFK